MEALEYREGGVELLPEITPLWNKQKTYHSTLLNEIPGSFDSATFEGRKDLWLRQSENGHLRLILVKQGESPVAYIVNVIDSSQQGEIQSLFVEESLRGQKVGDRLMQMSLDWMDSHSVKSKTVSVAVGNDGAARFYERYGFKPRATILYQTDE